MLVDPGVQIGLREGGLVDFLVTVFAVAIHVDHHVASKFLAKIERHVRYEFHREGIVTVYVENWCFDHFRDVRRVHGRAPLLGQSCKPNLVVYDHVHGATGAVAGQLRHVECLGDDPLPRESRVAMNKQRQNFTAMFGIVADALPCSRSAFDHGIDRFEVARVGRKPDLDFRARRKLPHRAITEMIFHVPVARDQVRDIIFAEFGEDDIERFFQKIREHIETAAVRHAHANLPDPGDWAFLQNYVENHH